MKEKFHQEDTIILNLCTPNTRGSRFIKERLLHLKSHVDTNRMPVGDLSTRVLTSRSSRQKLVRLWS